MGFSVSLRLGFPLLCTLLLGALGRPDPLLAQAVPDRFQVQDLATGLTVPTAMAFLPDGRILITEGYAGNVRLYADDTLDPGILFNESDVDTTGGERGLLGIAVDPRWPAKPYVYLCFTRPFPDPMVLARYTISGDLTDSQSTNLTFGTRYDVLDDIPDFQTIHNAGGLRFGPDDMLYVGLGDDINACAVQDSTVLHGSILRLDTSALPDTGTGPAPKALLDPGDNPFPPVNEDAALLFCKGLRNPFRFSVDPVTGGVYIGDVGTNKAEELNESFGGENFGYPYYEGPDTTGYPWCGPPKPTETYTPPAAHYLRTGPQPRSIIGGPRYRPVSGGQYNFNCQYDGALFFLEHYTGQLSVYWNIHGPWERRPFEVGQPDPVFWGTGFLYVADMLVGPDGALYYLTLFPGELGRVIYTGPPGNCDEPVGVPDDLTPTPGLAMRFPNPMTAGGAGEAVNFSLPDGERGVLDLISVTGRRVTRLFEGRGQGDHSVRLGDTGQEQIPAGVYFLRLTADSGRLTRRIVLLP